MPFVRTFENITPPKRDDGLPFTTVLVRENAVPTYVTAHDVETFALSPVDADPSEPISRSFTTALAQIQADGYYWLVWADATAAQLIVGPFQTLVSLSPLETRIRTTIPRTWDALAADEYIGVDALRMRIEDVKAISLPAIFANADESTYPKILLAYISKKCVLELIPPALEYWMRVKTAISNTGTNETSSFVDPTAALKDLARRLAVEIAQLGSNPDLTIYMRANGSAPGVSGTGDMLTPNPYEFEPPFASDVTVGNSVI